MTQKNKMPSDDEVLEAVEVATETHKSSMRLKDSGRPYCRFSAYKLPTLIRAATTPKVPQEVVDALKEAQFLCDRLDDYNPDDGSSEYYGHVNPSHSRLKKALAILNKGG